MARVTLEDGTVINFQGTPTQKDIEEVIASLDATPERETQSKSFLRPGELARSIATGAKEEFGESSKAIQEAAQRQKSGEQGFARTALTAVSQGAQAGLSTAFRGLIDIGSAILTDFIENPLRRKFGEKFDELIQSEKGQKAVSAIQSVAESIDKLPPKNKQ